MKNTILALFIATASVASSKADIVPLISNATASGTSGLSASVSVSSTEVVEFHGFLDTGNNSALVRVTISGKTLTAGLAEMVGQNYQGPLSFQLSSSGNTYGGILFYRIVPSSNYAKRENSPNGKSAFMASSKPIRQRPAPMSLPTDTAAR